MKRIVSDNNYVQLEEFNPSTNSYMLQLGFSINGLTYKIENKNVKFYLKEDYFYKNSVWSADVPLEINGTNFTETNIAEGLSSLFGQSSSVSGVSSVNGKAGTVVLSAEDVDAYTKDEVNELIGEIVDDIDDTNTEIAAINADLDAHETQIGENTQAIANKADNSDLEALSQQVGTNTTAIAEKASQDDLDTLSDNIADNYYTKAEVDQAIDEAVTGGGTDLTNYYNKTEVDVKLALKADASDTYTKSESDNKFQLKFTDVDDIRIVSELPSNPDSRTLYLIPVE